MAILVLMQNSLYGATTLKTQTKIRASEFTLYDLQGNQVKLSDFKNRPVILFFWTTWCPFCREKFPVLAREYPNMRAKNIELLAINTGEPKYRIESFLEGKDIRFSILLDGDSEVAYKYNLIGIPTFVLIDAEGLIQFSGNEFPSDYSRILNLE